MESLHGFYHNYFSQFIGRTGEIRLFNDLIEAADKKGFRGLIVSGFPGVGKSRLLYEFNCLARKKGFPVSTHHFREGRQGSSKTVWKHLIEGLSNSPISTVPAYNVFEEFLHTTKKIADEGPVCIFLDNIHLAPEPFHDELIEAVDALLGESVVLAGVYQDLPLHRKGSFLRFLSDLRHISYFAEYRLEPLGIEDSTRMIEQIIGDPVPKKLTRRIIELSEGNPLFIQEVSRTFLLQQIPTEYEEEDYWHTKVPQIIHTAISRRLQHLSPNCLEFIRKVSLAGEHFSYEEVEYLLEADALPSLDRCLDEALAHGFLIIEKNRRQFRFSHSLIHEAIRHTIPNTERKHMCRDMALKIENSGMDKEMHWAEKLAEWWREGGRGIEEKNKASRYALMAAEHAFSHRNFSLALELIENLLEPDKAEPQGIEEADMYYTVAQIKSFNAETSVAMEYFEKALRYYLKEKRLDKIQRLSMHPVQLPVGEPDITDPFVEILTDTDCTGAFRGMILVQYGGTLINYKGNYKKAELILNDAHEISRQTGDLQLKLQWLLTSSYLDYFLGNFYTSLQKLEAASGIVHTHGPSFFTTHLALGKCTVLNAMGRAREAEELIEPLLRSSTALQNSYNLHMPYVTATRIKMLKGFWNEASNYIDKGLARLPYNGMLLNYRILIEYIQGNIDTGDTYNRAVSALKRGASSGPYMFHVHAAAVQMVRALCTGETGELRKTVFQLREVFFHPNNHPFILVRAHILMCIIASLLNDTELAELHFKKLLRYDQYHLVRPYFKFRALSRAAHCMGTHEKAQHLMKKAVESAVYYHDRPMEAALLYESVQIHLTEHIEPPLCTELKDILCKALIMASEMKMLPLKIQTEGLLQQLSATGESGGIIHFHLTKREKEILLLVGKGLSNIAIANSLYISLNTVSNHIKNILKKTGTRNRIAAYTIAQERKLL